MMPVIARNRTSDGHIILGVHWEGIGAYLSAP